tara:strand:+ start:490 stop:1227 length:738 start_codon:yes stop_codon:yes gene_type:complete
MSSYAVITDTELKALAQAKVSGLAFMVYTALRSHSRNSNNHVFPSIGRLKLMLGDVFSRRSIHRALKNLENSGLIQINSKESKSRFVLLAMKVKEAVKKAANEVKSCMRPNRPTMRPNRPYKNRKKRNYYNYNKNKRTQDSDHRSGRRKHGTGAILGRRSEASPEIEEYDPTAYWPEAIANDLKKLMFATTLGVHHHMAWNGQNPPLETINRLDSWMNEQNLPVFGEDQDKTAKKLLCDLCIKTG